MTAEVLAAVEPSGSAGVLGFPVEAMSDAQLAEDRRRVQRLACRVEARRVELVGEVDRRGLARRQGFGSTTAWLMALSGEPAAVCRSRITVAGALEEMPETRRAFAAGEVPESRVRLLAQAQVLAPEHFARDEAALVAAVAGVSSQRTLQVLAAWKRQADLQGAEAEAERLQQQRGLQVPPTGRGWCM